MLTLDMLYAVIQGLPADHLDYLDRPWYLLAVRIERALKEGLDPASALHSALSNSADWERQVYLRAFIHEEPVLALPDLTHAKKKPSSPFATQVPAPSLNSAVFSSRNAPTPAAVSTSLSKRAMSSNTFAVMAPITWPLPRSSTTPPNPKPPK